MSRHHFPVTEHSRSAARTPDDPYVVAFARGSLELGYYSPTGVDHQMPHRQDEVYVIVQGRGKFQNGGEVVEFGPGDALFVPAGVEHRFVDFSEDTEMWVVFYGPEGGEDA